VTVALLALLVISASLHRVPAAARSLGEDGGCRELDAEPSIPRTAVSVGLGASRSNCTQDPNNRSAGSCPP
jgi:hypothetical protein